MNVTLNAPIMVMKIVLRSPEARYAQPEANSPLCCALVVPENILSSGL